MGMHRANPTHVELLATTPEVCEIFETNDLPYHMPFSVNDIPSLNDMMVDNIARVNQWSAWIERQIEECMPEASHLAFNPVRCCVTSALSFFTAYSSRVYALGRLIATLRPNKFLYFRPIPLNLTPLVFQPGESAWAEIAYAIQQNVCRPSWSSSITWESFPSLATRHSVKKRISKNYSLSLRIRRWLGDKKVKTLSFLGQFRQHAAFQASADPKIVILDGGGVELLWLLREAKSRPHLQSIYWPTDRCLKRGTGVPIDPAALAEIQTRCLKDPMVTPICAWDSVDWRPAMSGKLMAFFRKEWGRLWNAFQDANETMKDREGVSVIHGEVGHQNIVRTWLESATSLKIPTYFYQWGGGYGYYIQTYIELNELRSNYALTYTQTIANVFDQQVRTSSYGARVQSFPIGSPYFAHLRTQAGSAHSSATPTHIFYVPTTFSGMYWYGPNSNLEDTLLFQLQKIIIAGLLSWGRLPVVLKLHPTRVHASDSLQGWIKRKRLSIEICSTLLEKQLKPQYMWTIDYPSTILQQILVAGGRTIYVTTGNLNLYAEAQEAVKKSCIVIDGWAADFNKKLAAGLDRMMAGWQPDAPYFLRRYVNSEPPEAPETIARRALDTILGTMHCQPNFSVGDAS